MATGAPRDAKTTARAIPSLRPPRPRPSRAARFWALVPALILVGLIGTQLLVLRGVLHDPSFAVEPDYYEKAVDWDAHQEQARRNAELGWSLDVRLEPSPEGARVQVALSGPDGAPLDGATVSVEAFHNARASQISRAELSEIEPALYRGSIPARRSGLWELRLSARRAGLVYTEVARRELSFRGQGP